MFRGKWTKVPCILHWTIHKIDLMKPVEGQFQIRWTRGDSKGITDLITQKPGSNLLVFESHFECPCLMFISKENTVRPKIVAIELSRTTKKGKKKVYGKLSVDVGKYYHEKKRVTDSIEMETSQDVAPLFSATFGFHQIGKSDVVEAVDETDLSFIGKPKDELKTALNDWDLPTDCDDQISIESSSDAKKIKSKRSKNNDAKESDTPKARKRNNQGSGNERKRTHHKKSKHSSKSINEDQTDIIKTDSQTSFVEEDEQTVFKKENVVIEDVPKEESDKGNIPNEDNNDETFHIEKEENQNNDEIIEEKQEELQKIPIPETEEIENKVLTNKMEEEVKEEYNVPEEEKIEQETKTDLKEVFTPIFSLSNFVISKAFFDSEKKYRFPPAIFKLYEAFMQYNVFEEGAYTDEELCDFTNFFVTEIEKSNLVKEKLNNKFLLYLLLVLLIKSGDFPQTNTKYFIEKIIELIKTQVDIIIRPYLATFEGIANRFSTAKFDLDILLSDSKQVLRSFENSVKYPHSISTFLRNYFLSCIEIKLLNKLILNPSRFNFTNSMLWNSFINAFISDERIELNLLHETACAFIMIHNISAEPDMTKEICPNLDPKFILFIMKNFHLDSVMPRPVDCEQFKTNNHLNDSNEFTSFDKPIFVLNDNFNDLELQNWKDI